MSLPIMFVELTQWSKYRYVKTTEKLYINIHKILAMYQAEDWYVDTQEDLVKPVKERNQSTYTFIHLGGSPEEPQGYCVTQTPEEIFRAMDLA